VNHLRLFRLELVDLNKDFSYRFFGIWYRSELNILKRKCVRTLHQFQITEGRSTMHLSYTVSALFRKGLERGLRGGGPPNRGGDNGIPLLADFGTGDNGIVILTSWPSE